MSKIHIPCLGSRSVSLTFVTYSGHVSRQVSATYVAILESAQTKHVSTYECSQNSVPGIIHFPSLTNLNILDVVS